MPTLRAHALRPAWPTLLLALGCASGQVAHKTGPSGDPLLALDPPRRAQAENAAKALPCPCGGGRALLSCRDGCPAASRALRVVVSLARMGANAEEISREAMRQANTLDRAAVPLSLVDAPCRGPQSAKVTLVTFSDFQCPACAMFELAIRALAERADGAVRLCFRHFPLPLHPEAMMAAQAAELARAHGKFWELHDRLFASADGLGPKQLKARAHELGLAPALLDKALAQGTYRAAVEASIAEGKRAGVSGTPSVFVNGHPLTLPPLADLVEVVVEEELERIQQAHAESSKVVQEGSPLTR